MTIDLNNPVSSFDALKSTLEQLKEIKAENKTIKEKIKYTDLENKRLQESKEQTNTELFRLVKELSKLEDSNKSKDKIIADLKIQLKNVPKQNNFSKESTPELDEEIKHLKNEITELNNVIEDMDETMLNIPSGSKRTLQRKALIRKFNSKVLIDYRARMYTPEVNHFFTKEVPEALRPKGNFNQTSYPEAIMMDLAKNQPENFKMGTSTNKPNKTYLEFTVLP